MSDMYLTAEQAAIFAQVAKGTIHTWTRRGLISNYGTARQGWYSLAELSAVLRATPERR